MKEESNHLETNSTLYVLLITLLKGVLYRDDQEKLWQDLLHLQAEVGDYVVVLGLELTLFEEDGFAWLASCKTLAEAEDDLLQSEPQKVVLPKLVARRPLSYPLSLLLLVLRKRLLEFEAQSSELRLVLSFEEISDLVQPYLPTGSNEVKSVDRLNQQLNKVIEMGFLKRLKRPSSSIQNSESNLPENFEVRIILKSFIDSQWISDFEKRLVEYQAYSAEQD